MKATFRSEAFIVPSTNRREKLCDNEMDDVKVAKKFNDSEVTSDLEVITGKTKISVVSLIKDFELIIGSDDNHSPGTIEFSSPSKKGGDKILPGLVNADGANYSMSPMKVAKKLLEERVEKHQEGSIVGDETTNRKCLMENQQFLMEKEPERNSPGLVNGDGVNYVEKSQKGSIIGDEETNHEYLTRNQQSSMKKESDRILNDLLNEDGVNYLTSPIKSSKTMVMGVEKSQEELIVGEEKINHKSPIKDSKILVKKGAEKNQASMKDEDISGLLSSIIENEEIYFPCLIQDSKSSNGNQGIEQSVEEISSDLGEPIYDVPIPFSQRRPIKLPPKVKKSGDFIHNQSEILGDYSRPPMRTSSLMSIDEHGETQDNDDFDQFCCHGFKNGCTAMKQKPEEVSAEIFEENWLKRLEGLRVREAIIKDKEAMLFERERLLFKKEKELRILERLLKDKLRHAELYIKRCRSQNGDSASLDGQSKHSEICRDSQSSRESQRQQSSMESLESCRGKIINEQISSEIGKSVSSISCKSNCCEVKSMKNPPNSKSSLTTATSVVVLSPRKKLELIGSNFTSRNTISGFNSHSSFRRKPRPKMTYDDLDSTLSADIGDSSYIVTSKKFDPEVFKKPLAFTRSSSERRPKSIIQERPLSNIFEDEKVLKRISENIFVSQDKDTKFQDYGLIDLGTRVEEKGHAYLDLEQGRPTKEKMKTKKDGKDRPVSWNEESNEWLQKKRQAYNWATNRIPIEDFESVENHHDKENRIRNKIEMNLKKKSSKGRKFGIFR